MANKTSKKTSKKDFYLTIISTIQKDMRLPKHINKQRLNYYVKKLKLNGIIAKKGYGTWELTSLGVAYLDKKEVKTFCEDALVQPPIKELKTSKKKDLWVRGHGYMWNVKTPLVKNKLKVFKLLDKKKLRPVMTETKQIKFFLMGHNVKIGARAINVNFNPDLYYSCKTARECHKMAVYDLVNLIVRLERLLGYSLRVKGTHQFRPCKKHFGNINNELAGRYKKAGKYVQVFDKGKEWLVIDFSDKKFVELETTDNDRNIVDNDFIIDPFFNKLRHRPKILDELETKLERMESIINRQNNVIEVLVDARDKERSIQRFIN